MNIFKKKINVAEESLTKLQGEFDALNEKYAQLEAEFKALKETEQTLVEEKVMANVEIEELQTELEVKSEELEEVKEEIVEVVSEKIDVDTLASLKAVEILASCGAEPVEILEAPEDEELFDAVKQFKKLSGKDQQEFYAKYNSEIKKALKNR